MASIPPPLPPDSGFSSYEESPKRLSMSTTTTTTTTSSSSTEFWLSETDHVDGVRYHTMLSSTLNKRGSLRLKVNNKKNVSKALYHPLDVAVHVNAPVKMQAEAVKSSIKLGSPKKLVKKRSVKKKSGSIQNALVNPLDVAVNVNTPDKSNITLEAFKDFARDIDPTKPRSRKHGSLIKHTLVAPLDIAVNVNTPADIKFPINHAALPKKRTSICGDVIKPPPPSQSKVDLRTTTPDSTTVRHSSCTTRKFSIGASSIFTLSGCSESSCSSISESDCEYDEEYSCGTPPIMMMYQKTGLVSASDQSRDSTLEDTAATPKPTTGTSVFKRGGERGNSLKSWKGSMISLNSIGSSVTSKKPRRRASVVTALYPALDVAVQVNTPVDARKVSAFFTYNHSREKEIYSSNTCLDIITLNNSVTLLNIIKI